MTRDDLACMIQHGLDKGWTSYRTADNLISAGVVIDSAPDHRYEAALKVLDSRGVSTPYSRTFARAIVAALDADARGPRDR